MPISKARFRISDYNARRKADVQKNERRIRVVSLSLTSMVDMFAILVIFLLTSQDSVSQMVDLGHGIQLPKAKFNSPPPRAGTVQIGEEGVFADGKPLIKMDELLKGGDRVAPVTTWLEALKAKKSEKAGYLNLVAHTKIPFGAVRRVVATAQAAGFSHLNLAVEPAP